MHYYELHNSTPALYPVYHPVQISDIRPGDMDNLIDVTVEFPEQEKVYHVDFSKELSQKVSVDSDRYINISLTPRDQYTACGSSQHGWITVTDTNIPYKSPFTPEQWLPEITASESLTIRGRVGVNLEGGDHQKAVTIMRYIRENLIDHMGTPSDEINKLSPLGQFDAAVKGNGRLQCNNLVDIFVKFCAAYGVIARRINLWQGGVWSKEQVNKLGYNLLTAGGHTTAEIFDRINNRWMWFDPMYGLEWGVTLAELQQMFIRDDDDLPCYIPFEIWRNYLSEQQRIVYVCPRKL